MKLIAALSLLVSLNTFARFVEEAPSDLTFQATVTSKETYFASACERATDKAKLKAKNECDYRGYTPCKLVKLEVSQDKKTCTATAKYKGTI